MIDPPARHQHAEDPTATAEGPAAPTTPQWLAFSSVTGAYLAVTVAESLLAPALPTISADLSLALDRSGVALGALTGAVAVGNLLGGFLLARRGSRTTLVTALLVTLAGCVLTATAAGWTGFLSGQVAVGFGAGVCFPAGLQAAAFHAGSRRRGLAMALFGVAFSGGLTVAAVLAALGTRVDWRLGFVVAAVLCVVAVVTISVTPLPDRGPSVPLSWSSLRVALGSPVVVAGIASIGQYGTVGFLPTYAVLGWGMSAAQAALLLAVARVLSTPAKVLAGLASDRFGSRRTIGGLGGVLVVTGLAWTTLEGGTLASATAVVFAATVSAVFPVSNVLAVERFGGQGALLGVFRSAQIAAGALGAWAVGFVAAEVGLGGTLTATVLLPVVFLVMARERRPRRSGPDGSGDLSAPRPDGRTPTA